MNHLRPITSVDLCSDPENLYAPQSAINVISTFPWDPRYQFSAPYTNLELLDSQFSDYPDLNPLFNQLTHPIDFDFNFDFQTYPEDSSAESNTFEIDWNSPFWDSGLNTDINSPDELGTGSSPDCPLPATRDAGKHHCEHCSQYFATKSELARHTRKHTKPFGCENGGCTKSFAEKRDRDRHLKSCSRKTVSPSSQSDGDRQFKCHVCDFAAWRSDSVQRHIQTRHRAKKCRPAPVALLPKPN